ncbi:hypothetical protein HYT91_03790 [Candidatus Pacearchaeota archaeon]|nr:hypothetical protein [Candidatus Pacearchaeota archaeon]
MIFKLFLALIIGLFLLFPVMAQDYKTFDDFFEDIPSLNEKLQSSEMILPKPADFLISNGNVVVEIMMSDGEVKEFYFNIENKRVANIFIGKPEEFHYLILTDEEAANDVLASEDKLQTILLYYKNKEIKVKSVGFGNKIKFSFVKIFLKNL